MEFCEKCNSIKNENICSNKKCKNYKKPGKIPKNRKFSNGFKDCKWCNQTFPESDIYFREKINCGYIYFYALCRDCEKKKRKHTEKKGNY